MILIQNATVHDAVHETPYLADILIRDGKIAAIGAGLEVPADCQVVDAGGLSAYPGFVDAHSHLGLDNYGMGYEGHDYNEMNDITAAGGRAIDSFNPQDAAIPLALAGGVTCVGTGPGSANVLGGTFIAVKTVGKVVDQMIVREPVAMKCAFGENPKRCYRDKGDSARMTTAAHLRRMLYGARQYMLKKEAADGDVTKEPTYDMKYEALIPVLKGEIPLKAHAHRADDLFTAIRIAREFGVKLTLEHCTEGHLVADELAQAGYPMAVGPTLTNASKIELVNKSWTTPGVLAAKGCHVSIITDAPVIPQQYLPLCAGLAVKAGMKPFDALQAITIHPAEHLGIENRVGSLETGKDADIVLTDGDPMDSLTNVVAVFVDGRKVVG